MLRPYFNYNERLEICLIWFCNILCYSGDITDYELEFMTQKFKKLDEIHRTEIFAVVKFWFGQITEFLR